MKILSTFLFLTYAFLCTAQLVDVKGYNTVSFEKIGPGEIVEYTFQLKNNSNDTIKIKSIQSTGKNLSVLDYPKDSVLPNKSLSVIVEYTAPHQSTYFTEEVKVKTTRSEVPVYLRVFGAVETNEQPIAYYQPLERYSRPAGSYGYIDRRGMEVIPPRYEWAGTFHNGMAQIKSGSKWGYINKAGEEVIPPKYDINRKFDCDGFAKVSVNRKWGIIDKTGKTVVPVVMDKIYGYDLPFYEGLACVQRGDSVWFVNQKGDKVEVFDRSVDYLTAFHEGLAAFKDDGYWGFVDTSGSFVVEPRYDDVDPFSGGMAKVFGEGKWGFVNREGEEVIPLEYASVNNFHEGLALVKTDSAMFYINKENEPVIHLHNYEEAGSFHGGIAMIVKDGERGYIDTKGNIVITPDYNYQAHFHEGLTKVNIDNGWGYLDAKGKLAIPAIYPRAGDFGEGLAPVSMPFGAKNLSADPLNEDYEVVPSGFKRPMDTDFTFTGHVIDKVSKEHIAGLLRLSIQTEKGFDYMKVVVNEEGYFEVPNLAPGVDYFIHASAPGYFAQDDTIAFLSHEDTVVTKNISLKPIQLGETVQLEKVLFKQGTADILPQSYSELDYLVQTMQENPEMEIKLAGHTDNTGSKALSMELSEERVAAVKAYLVDKGIDQRRISGEGYGGTKPIASNATEASRQLNRRVEFLVIKK